MKALFLGLISVSSLTSCDEGEKNWSVDYCDFLVDYCDDFKDEYALLFMKCWSIKYGYMEIEGFDIKFFREYITFFLQATGTPVSLKLLQDFKRSNFEM